jgi:hypothetical protein
VYPKFNASYKVGDLMIFYAGAKELYKTPMNFANENLFSIDTWINQQNEHMLV